MENSKEALASYPRLQGLAPHRESVTSDRWFRPAGARSSHGPSLPSRVLTLATMTRPSPRTPLMQFTEPGANDGSSPTSGYYLIASLAGLSRDCRPSWGFLPYDESQKLGLDAILESPPQMLGVRHRPLQLIFESSNRACRSLL
jgi:hypothetical protein